MNRSAGEGCDCIAGSALLSPPPMFERLKSKWGVASTKRMLVIFLVFSLAGTSMLYVRKIFWPLLGFTPETSRWITVPVYLLLMIPTYQVMLITFGTLLGEFAFFWQWEKKFAHRMGGLFRRRNAPPPAAPGDVSGQGPADR